METIAFRMQLKPGAAQEYSRRHAEIWPELKALLKSRGIADYAIFLDTHTGMLFATLKIKDRTLFQELPAQPLMQRWWEYMSTLMESNEDLSPITFPLKKVFHLP